MYDQVVKCQRAGLCLSEHFLILCCILVGANKQHSSVQFNSNLWRLSLFPDSDVIIVEEIIREVAFVRLLVHF